MKEYRVIGLMSGTSLDGLDIAYCKFAFNNEHWTYEIVKATTIDYNQSWRGQLSDADLLSGNDLWRLHVQLGHYFGKQVKEFISNNEFQVDFVCSSGHTVFHRPELGYTAQIGDGASIAAECGIDTICDFRSSDVAFGGQGAPLVPIGDKLLFSNYDYCLNIGGICNISFNHNNERIAWDVAPANMLLNYYASSINLLFDNNGDIAASGILNQPLLKMLNNIEYYHTQYPKSLGKEYVFENFINLIDKFEIPVADIMATICEHIAIEVSKSIYSTTNKRLLITGGGALNTYLISRIKAHSKHEVVIPEIKLIHYKEALIFGFLGVLRIECQENCLKEVTGALQNCISGAIYKGLKRI
ncbi:MAG: anhydro-N-acetylmuramic acid kinase [Bacteroidota bacterium]